MIWNTSHRKRKTWERRTGEWRCVQMLQQTGWKREKEEQGKHKGSSMTDHTCAYQCVWQTKFCCTCVSGMCVYLLCVCMCVRGWDLINEGKFFFFYSNWSIVWESGPESGCFNPSGVQWPFLLIYFQMFLLFNCIVGKGIVSMHFTVKSALVVFGTYGK